VTHSASNMKRAFDVMQLIKYFCESWRHSWRV